MFMCNRVRLCNYSEGDDELVKRCLCTEPVTADEGTGSRKSRNAEAFCCPSLRPQSPVPYNRLCSSTTIQVFEIRISGILSVL